MDLDKLECPFTWEIDESLVLNEKLNEKSFEVTKDEQPVIAFMDNIILVFIGTLKKDYRAARDAYSRAYCVHSTMDFEQAINRGVSSDVLLHIAESSYFFLNKAESGENDDEQYLNNMKPLQYSDKKVGCTIKACQSLVWYKFKDIHEPSYWLSLTLAKGAADECPEAPLWHFLVGRSLLHPLCFHSLTNWPFSTELKHLHKAYELTGCPFFGIHIEQVFRAIGEEKTAELVRLTVHDSKPRSVLVRLKLALAFIQCGDLQRAKECIDFVSVVQQNDHRLKEVKQAFSIKKMEMREAPEDQLFVSKFDCMKL